MRLLNVHSLTLSSFVDELSAPPYAILSHTWGVDEVLFEHVAPAAGPSAWLDKKGARKVQLSAKQAQVDGLEFIWIDTCCIDKMSSTELSEAINSMFKWYAASSICYAYLEDLDPGCVIGICRWFTRGWTLQELIAPDEVQFFDQEWTHVGSRTELAPELSNITAIDVRILFRRSPFNIHSQLDNFNIATRMSWASRRTTTRTEDLAYCLMGIFNVNMPLLYGEGMKAFRRLQEEIVKRTDDNSILAFVGDKGHHGGLLAFGPQNFPRPLPRIQPWASRRDNEGIELSASRISVQMVLIPTDNVTITLASFDCAFGNDHSSRPAIALTSISSGGQKLYLRLCTQLFKVGRQEKSPVACSPSKTMWDGIVIRTKCIYESASRERITILNENLPSDADYKSKSIVIECKILQDIGPYLYCFGRSTRGGFAEHKTDDEGRTCFVLNPDPTDDSDMGLLEVVRGKNQDTQLFVAWGHFEPLQQPSCFIWTKDQISQLASIGTAHSMNVGQPLDPNLWFACWPDYAFKKFFKELIQVGMKNRVPVMVPWDGGDVPAHSIRADISQRLFLDSPFYELTLRII